MKTYPPLTKIIQWNLPSLNKDHPMKMYPPSTKIIQWKLTLPQQRSSNENLPFLNKDHPIKTYAPSTKIIQINLPSLNKDHPMKTCPRNRHAQQRSTNENLPYQNISVVMCCTMSGSDLQDFYQIRSMMVCFRPCNKIPFHLRQVGLSFHACGAVYI